MSAPLNYKDAGVDMQAGDDLVDAIKPLAKRTMRPGVLAGIGGFGAMFEVPKTYQEPVLVSGTDGVGTKLRLAFEWNIHNTVGIDLVAMSVNDILVQGAEPLYFLDYFACGKLDLSVAVSVIEGIASGCKQAGCALIGGETAEMPGMYPDGEYDLAGFAVGVVEKSEILDARKVQADDVILGLASNGIHSNGFSLVRKILDQVKPDLDQQCDGMTLREAIMAPTRIYVKPVLDLIKKIPVHALAHITGGGIVENIPRVLPPHLMAELDRASWPETELFQWLQNTGPVPFDEMNRVFNCGIGMIIILPACHAQAAQELLSAAGEKVYQVGVIRPRLEGQAHTLVKRISKPT